MANFTRAGAGERSGVCYPGAGRPAASGSLTARSEGPATLRRVGDIRIYHNPACSHSRGALEILEQRSADPDVVLYLKTPPSKAELERFLDLLEDPPADLVRKDKRFAELGLVESDYQTVDQVIAVLLEHPELMQRPIIVKDNRAVLARPSEKVLTLLDD